MNIICKSAIYSCCISIASISQSCIRGWSQLSMPQDREQRIIPTNENPLGSFIVNPILDMSEIYALTTLQAFDSTELKMRFV